ncbi:MULTISPECIES: MATE family efflux transporter [unclassified Bradyrhizobium]|uniref:MATE family efflux transporter n=1 Tax=unclassified Bradyrhizobium TaxID=2631580 RepID=UPI001FFA9184|nr:MULTISPECIES: MATE family efflux transporter [unclassified Bradyrhizobium]
MRELCRLRRSCRLISTSALAAHQIALQITVITSMLAFGISMGPAVRVGHAVGRRRSRHQAGRSGRDAARYAYRCLADRCGDRRAA